MLTQANDRLKEAGASPVKNAAERRLAEPLNGSLRGRPFGLHKRA
jgi:hypothetical protein